MSWNSFDTRDVQSITRINTNIRIEEMERKYEQQLAIVTSELRSHKNLILLLQTQCKRTFENFERALKNAEDTIRQLQAKNEENEELLEALWYAPGGPAAAALIVQYDHRRENAK